MRDYQAPIKLLRLVFFEKLEINYCHPSSPSITHSVHTLHICYQFIFPPFYSNCLWIKKKDFGVFDLIHLKIKFFTWKGKGVVYFSPSTMCLSLLKFVSSLTPGYYIYVQKKNRGFGFGLFL